MSRAGGGTQVLNVTVNVAGTVVAERELDKHIDATLKEKLKQMGWN
ncbi:hypothetical protein [Candidatus Nitrososphaera sp. FF02]